MKVLAILYEGGQAASEEPRLLGTVQNQLGLRAYLESSGHEYIVSSSKEGPDSDFQKHIVDVRAAMTYTCLKRTAGRLLGRGVDHDPFPSGLSYA
jgi:formate dehydrogenase